MASRIAFKPSQRAPESTSLDAERSPKARLIGQVLDTLRFQGWFFCISELRAPWAFKLPGNRLAALHAVLEGECLVHLAGQSDYARLGAGDIVLLPRDHVHVVADRPGRAAVPVEAVAAMDRRDRIATTFTHDGGGARTRLLTASFISNAAMAKAIVSAPPAMVVLRNGSAGSDRVAAILTLVRLEAVQPGGVSSAVLRRAAEILFVQALHRALMDVQADSGWLAAATDDRLTYALIAMHSQPEHRWTLAELSKRAHLSRTAFFNRFQHHLGQTPGEYLQAWRLQLAAQRLKETRESVGDIALTVGYESASAFARAFKRATGHSPNDFRSVGD
ncbi:MAG: AraC family transcriptional regulator [Rhodocyclaceae bacterium]|nr:AraC family transcriptional regulator [Rhodocyclaceae bacterium]